ncbi:hexitol phosphatase HxpB [Wenzhouxiangella marina]|uniref:Haloacid dehalogenase superfamily protein, subfamily IA, variant 3 with third motif having DD or ED n=1 Tax=Wenzhouxiangella marina TaxID=1579979 RepID=A0A0K0XWY9_9GAMM|nr:hexitol phosphatase HxpB [Wenzhouxiangella marina]AKS42157.1 Haloacid dehalogenase superfamily protein, subfamily IA, variant 3 with third motif having DD or ED [Wenzhouxiangella marina]MBB6086071.1 sugar-phosphatase [Wenzhouxiangella marina]
MSRIRAVIFDMDGLLIDSEPLWQDAEIACFRPLGVPITRELCRESAGRRIDEVIEGWHARFAWESPSCATMVERVVSEVTRLILERGQSLPGVHELMDRLDAHGLELAIASSSPPALIDAVVERLGLDSKLRLCHSGVLEARSKPDPAVFLSTAAMLGLRPEQCLVFEDAPAGVLAAHRAGMRVFAVPSVFEPDEPGFELAERVLSRLDEFQLDWL